jgi:hypothetical protein
MEKKIEGVLELEVSAPVGLSELNDMQLAYVGGGMGETVL